MIDTSYTNRSLLLLSSRPWNIGLANRLSIALNRPIEAICNPAELSVESVKALDPEWIFVPHWNHFIQKSIWRSWPTVIFHMTNLPYGRGGSPLQNMIQLGHTHTKLTALQCSAELDAGPIYIQKTLSLHGTAEEIFLRADKIIEAMIFEIITTNTEPSPQKGEPVIFNRRKPSQSNLGECTDGDLAQWYDYIRMLDAEGYPHAFLETNGMRLEFRRVSQRSDGLYADVRISISTTFQEGIA